MGKTEPTPPGLTRSALDPLSRAVGGAAGDAPSELLALMDSLPHIVWTTSPDGSATYFNRRWYEYTGQVPGDFERERVLRAVHPEDLPELLRRWTEGFAGESPITCEYRLRSRDGGYRWHLGRVVPVRDPQGRISRWVGSATEIEEQKRLALEYRTLTEAIPNLIWRTNLEGKVDFANPAFTEYTGLTAEQLNERGWAALIHPDDLGDIGAKWLEAKETGRAYRCPFRLKGKDGAYRWMLRQAHPVTDTSGRIAAWIGTTSDIHELYETKERLEASEAQLRLITNALPVLIAYVDAGFRYRFVNQGYERWFSRPSSQIVGRPVIEIVGVAQFETVKPQMERALRGEAQTWQVEAPYEFGKRWIEVSFVPDRGEAGEVRGFFSLVRDISEQKALEQARLEAENKFRAFFEQSPLANILYATDGTPLEANRAWEELFETSREELRGYNSLQDPQLEATGVADLLRRAIAGEVVELPTTYNDPRAIGRKGRGRWIQGVVSPIRDHRGQVIQIGVVLKDVTDRENALAELQRANQELEQAVRARQDLLNICGHELKTPLSGLKLQTQIAKRRIEKGDPTVYEPAKVRRLLDSYDSQIDRLVHLVDDMLDLTRLSSGKLALNLERIDLSRVVLEVLDRFGNQISASGCSIGTSLAPNVVGAWDRLRIEQVLTNLLTNALKYGQGSPISVTVSRSTDRRSAVLTVSDQGRGIAPEHQERIFDRFERAVSATEVSGLGLGLFITREIVHAHGGAISVRSEIGRGATFVVELPVAEV